MGYAPGHRRTTPLPRDWPRLRRQTLRRCGHRCEWEEYGDRCTARATHADHIVPSFEGGDDNPDNLQGLCPPHHEAKTAQEAGRARAAQKARHMAKGTRPVELSPAERMKRGLL